VKLAINLSFHNFSLKEPAFNVAGTTGNIWMCALNKRALTFVQGGLIVANPDLSLWGGRGALRWGGVARRGVGAGGDQRDVKF
jgi:hypothetical protein